MNEDTDVCNSSWIPVGEALDHIVTAPIANWALLKRMPLDVLYRAARSHAGGSLSAAAGHMLMERVQPGDRVLILSGFVIRGYGRPETDGLIGAAVLGRALALGLGAVPVGITDDPCVAAYEACLSASGLVPASIDSLHEGRNRCAILPFPLGDSAAREAAREIVHELSPSVVIAVERPGANYVDRYHGGGGFDITDLTAKTDVLFQLATNEGIPTIGIGDLGNEVGMGVIADEVRTHVEYGKVCCCGCQSGIAAVLGADVTVIATVANWGAYAIAAYLAAALSNEDVFHTPELEVRMIERAVCSGAIDPVGGQLRDYVDGIPASTNAAIVELLRSVVLGAGDSKKELEEYRASWKANAERR